MTREWLATALRQRWKTYCERLRQCRRKHSAEAVHEFRVASRRLMSQVTLLGGLLPGRQSHRAHALLKRQLRSLGELRDNHVLQTVLKQQASRFPEVFALLGHLERAERRLIAKATRKIEAFKPRKLEHIVQGVLEVLTSQAGHARREERVRKIVLRQADQAFAEVTARRRAIDFADLGTIHRTRVAFKRFRYILEALPPELSGFTPRELRALAWYQRRMGILQDLVVMTAWIREHSAEHPATAELLAPFCHHLRRRQVRALHSFRRSADRLFEFWPPDSRRR
jgi:CHAD domain-containing protein